MRVLRADDRVASVPLDVERVRKDFPILDQQIRGKPLV